MIFGLDVFRRYPSPIDLVRDSKLHLSEQLAPFRPDLLTHCSIVSRTSNRIVHKILSELLLTDSRKRPSAGQLVSSLLESSTSTIMPSQISTTPTLASAWKTIAKSTPLLSPNMPLSRSVEAQASFFWQPRPSGSRYRSEFEELEFLGRGGGGQVVKARNRLDGHLYAVKKIRLPNDRASETKILREVTIWSRMNHPK